MKTQLSSITILSGTHWDREWYRPFQGFRHALVRVLTEVIEMLEAHPDFGIFTLDGQTVVLEDYLEIRPDMRGRLLRLIQSGRILIGPWYCMPDEFLVSGESLIRNLRKGFSVSRAFGGEPWRYGYLCDIFGHIAQMPQILSGFGIEAALIGRGTNEGDFPMHFLWESPDGTRCVALKVPDHMLYGDFTCRAVLPFEAMSTEAEKDALLLAEVERQAERTDLPVLLLMDALDHMPIHLSLIEIRTRLQRLFPEARVVIGDAVDMAREVKNHTDLLPVHAGQLYDTARDAQPAQRRITHTLSSRYDIKKDNDHCQTLLEKQLGPLRVIAHAHGLSVPERFEGVAEEYLLKNHPHDSLCGCSVDAVHADMGYRSRQVRAIAEEVRKDIFHHILHRLPIVEAAGCVLIQLFNPLPYERREIVRMDLPMPSDFPRTFAEEPFGFEPKPAFLLRDSLNGEIPYSLLGIRRGSYLHDHGHDSFFGDVCTVSFRMDLNPCGFNYVQLEPAPVGRAAVRYPGSLSTSSTSAENDWIGISVSGDGGMELVDRRSGQVYGDLLSFLDDGEIGDGWNHVEPAEDRCIVGRGRPIRREILQDDATTWTCSVTTLLEVPIGIERRKGHAMGFSRSRETCALEIESRITLHKDSAAVMVEMDIQNTAKDHRVRVLFPTGVHGATFCTSQPFAFMQQNSGHDERRADWNERDSFEKPMSGIVYKSDGAGRGLAVVSAFGLHECADLHDGTLAITLLRSFSKTVFTDGETEGQLQGRQSYRFALVPMDENTTPGSLNRIQDELSVSIEASFRHNVRWADPVPASPGFVVIEGDSNVSYSTLKWAEDGTSILLRLFNPTGVEACAIIQLAMADADVWLASMDEIPGDEVPSSEGSFAVRLAPFRIQTYRIKDKNW